MCVRMIFAGAVLVASSVLTGCAGMTPLNELKTNAIRENQMQVDRAALALAQGHPIVVGQVSVNLAPEFTNEPRAFPPAVYRAMLDDTVHEAAQNARVGQGRGSAYRADVNIYRLYMADGKISGLYSRVTLFDPAGRTVASIPLETMANSTLQDNTSNMRYAHRYQIPGNASAIVTLLRAIQTTGALPAKIHPGAGWQSTYYGLAKVMPDDTTERYAAMAR